MTKLQNYDRSMLLDARYKEKIASRVWSPTIPGNRSDLFFESADGAYLFDANCNRYVDFNNAKGSVLLGHNDTDVNSAIQQFLTTNGNIQTGPSKSLIDLADIITEDVPGGSNQIAFFSTGTAAVRAATDIVKQKTRRIVLLSSGYHGWDPMWSATSNILEVNAYGVVDVFFIPELLDKALRMFEGKVAAYVISPEYVNLSQNTLVELVSLCKRHGVPVICDDVKQGYRYSPGPSISKYNLAADIYVFSKGLCNGGRLSCVCGDESYMRYAAELTYTTYFDSVSIVAALETLRKMRAMNGYDRIGQRGDKFLEGLRNLIKTAGLPIEVNGDGHLFQLVFASPEQAEWFYSCSTDHGLVFYANDNQCPSLAFDTQVYDTVLHQVGSVLQLQIEQFPEIQGQEVTDTDRFVAAWGQMDGASDCLPVSEQLRILESLRA